MSAACLQSISERFSAAADTYDLLSTPQCMVAERLARIIPPHADGSHILEIGCGTGLLTTHILKRFPNASLDALDVSSLMISRARARFGDNPRIRWFATDVSAFKPLYTYPLVVSSSSLHWLPDIHGGIRHLAALVKPGGHMAFSMMLGGTLGELHETRMRIAPHKPPLRKLPRADEALGAVAAAGMRILESSVEDYKASYRGASAFLQTLHDQGVTGGEFSRSTHPLTRGELKALTDEYDRQYLIESGHVYATYRVLFVHAFKSAGV